VLSEVDHEHRILKSYCIPGKLASSGNVIDGSLFAACQPNNETIFALSQRKAKARSLNLSSITFQK